MQVLTFLSVVLSSFLVFSAPKAEVILKGDDLAPQSLEEMVQQIPENSIVVIGEQHGFPSLASQQVAILQALRAKSGRVNVGMEFLYWPNQAEADDYRAGKLAEAEFLTKINWGQPDFKFYREQILFPEVALGEKTLALNAPRSLTGRISKVGIAGLTDAEKALMPPDYINGNTGYYERFKEIMGGHVPEASILRYFEAQSVWDSTMAWKAAGSPDNELLVIVVGEFHVAYGGGLPDQLKLRYPNRPIVTLSQIRTEGMTAAEIDTEISPNGKYGARAHFLLLHPQD